jgi:hypothetical protein
MSTTESVIYLVVAISAVISSAGLGVRWLTKHYFDEIKHELKPNGGSSMKDQVNRIEVRQDMADSVAHESYTKLEKLDNKIDDLYDKFIEFLANNNKK